MNLDDAQTRLNYFSAKAKKVEDAIRERALLPVREEINGIEVVQFTLEHWLILSAIKSPFLIGGREPDIFDIGTFLWIVSPGYNVNDFTAAGIIGKVKRFIGNWKRKALLRRVVRQRNAFRFDFQIRKYLKRAFMDRPPTSEKGTAISAGLGASMIFRIAYGTYGGVTRKEVREMPLSEAFQYLNWTNAHLPQFRPLQDAASARLMEWADRKAKAAPVNGTDRINGAHVDG